MIGMVYRWGQRCPAKGSPIVRVGGLEPIRALVRAFPRRLRTFFEEWGRPGLISPGIRWVEVAEIAGGAPFSLVLACAESARSHRRSREVVAASTPEAIFRLVVRGRG